MLKVLKENEPLILLASFTMIVSTFLANNNMLSTAFESSVYATFSFFGAFTMSIFYSFIRPKQIEKLIEKIPDLDDKIYFIAIFSTLLISIKIAMHVFFAMGMIFIIIAAYDLSSLFLKLDIIKNLIISTTALILIIILLYITRIIKIPSLRKYIKFNTIMLTIALCYQIIDFVFIILEVLFNITYNEFISYDLSYWFDRGFIIILMMIIVGNFLFDTTFKNNN